MPKTWKKLRVVVEVAVQDDRTHMPYNARDLRWHVDRLVGGAKLNTRPGEKGVRFGTVRVKEYGMVAAAEERKRRAS